MKQTAVEWLINEINMQYPKINVMWKAWIIDNAKEMENENQLNLIMFLRTQDKMGKSVEDLHEQFKS